MQKRRYLVSHNSLGLRDKEYSSQPEPGVFRILALGPRMYGDGLSEQDGPVRQLEAHVRSRGFNVEVINAGLTGANASHYVQRLPELLEAYSPHAVIFEGLIYKSYFEDLAAEAPSQGANRADPIFDLENSWRTALAFSSEQDIYSHLTRATLGYLKTLRSLAESKGSLFFVVNDSLVVSNEDRKSKGLGSLVESFSFRFYIPGLWMAQILQQERFQVLALGNEFDATAIQERTIGKTYFLDEHGSRKFAEVLSNQLKPFLARPSTNVQAPNAPHN